MRGRARRALARRGGTGYAWRCMLVDSMSGYAVLPFVALLACIAMLPLTAPHFWETNRNKGAVAAVLALPVAAYLLKLEPAALTHALIEYVSFMALLGS